MSERQAIADQVRAANLGPLAPDQQTILTRYYLEHHTMQDIAEDLGMREDHARVARDEALAQLEIK